MNATLLMGVLLRAQAGETGQDDGLTPRVDEGQLVAESDQVQEPPQTPPEPEPAGPIARAMEDAMPDTGVESVDSALEILSQSVGDLIDSIAERFPYLAADDDARFQSKVAEDMRLVIEKITGTDERSAEEGT